MQFGYRRFSMVTVATKRATVTKRSATFPRTGSMLTLSYIGATLGKIVRARRGSFSRVGDNFFAAPPIRLANGQRGSAGDWATASVSPPLPSGMARR